MPLPPRSVRVSGYHVRRSSASPSLLYVEDVRAEMALLPQSAPTTASTSGVRLAQIVRRASPASSRPSTPMREREIPLATLIEAHSGKGRPPRSGTAQGLGYDVVPRPEVVALDDKDASTDTPRVPSMPTPSEAARRSSPSRSPKQRSPRLVPTTSGASARDTAGGPGGAAGAGTTPPLDSTGTSVTSTISGSPRRFWSWGEPVTPKLEPTEDEEWEYVDVEDGMVGDLELEVVKEPIASGMQGLAYAEVVRH